MGDNQWAYGKKYSDPEIKAQQKRMEADWRKPTFWDERSKYMKKHEWPQMTWSYGDEESEDRYKHWTDKELIGTAGYLLEERTKVLEEDLHAIKAVASSHLYELERRLREKGKKNVLENNSDEG